MSRKLAILAIAVATAFVSMGAPAVAAPSLDVTITAIEVLPTTAGGTFGATGPAVAAGLICPDGTTTNDFVGTPHGPNPVRFHVDKTFSCTGSSDTFSLRLHVALDTVTGFTTATWKVTDATGSLAGLKGRGTLVGTPIVVGSSISDVYVGRLR